LRESGHTLLTETLLAQSEAVKRNTTVRLATSGASIQVLDISNPGSPVLLRERSLLGAVQAPVTSFDLGPEGRPEPFGTSVAVNLSMTGQTCSANVRCPGLRIDAGGATRLCADHTGVCP
jgi:type IV fimbrial biogenesis protein FimT